MPSERSDEPGREREMITVMVCVGSSCHVKGARDIIEQFDEMLTRVKTAGLALLDPEVIRAGSNYMGHLKLFAEDARKRPYAFALDCVGDFQQSKITLHFYAESAELVMALRGRMLSALAGKG